MGFIQSLLRQRKLLSSLARPMTRDFVKPHQTMEQLEPRQLYSVVPVTDAAAALSISSIDALASNYSGQSVIAWTNQETGELNIAGIKADGTSLLSDEAVTAVPWTDQSPILSSIAFNNAGQGVICGTTDTGIVALQFTISNGTLTFADTAIELATESLPENYTISSLDVTIDGSGNFSLAWIGTADMDVTPASGADPIGVSANSVFLVRYNDTTDTFGSVKTVWAATASTGSYTSAGDTLDIATGSDGSAIVAWNTLAYTCKENADFEGIYDTVATSTSSYFARYSSASAVLTSPTLVNTVSLTNFDGIEKNDIRLITNSTGAFIVTQDQYFTGVTEGTDGEITVNEKAQLTFRSYSSAGKALSSALSVNTRNTMISTSAFTLTSGGNIVALWTEAASDEDPELLHSQTYTSAGVKVGGSNTLDIGVDPLTSLTVVSTGDTYRAIFSGTEAETGTDVIMTTQLQDLKADLTIDITGGTLPDTLTIGKEITGTMTFSIGNIGGFAYSGKSNVTLILSADEVLGNEDDIQIIVGSFTLSIDAGAAKSVTLSGIKIAKTALANIEDGSVYQLFAKLDAVTGTDMNSDNNTTSTEVTIAAANTILDIGADSVALSVSQTILVPGDSGTATIVVRNTGNTDLTKDDIITVELFAVSADDPEGTGISLGTKTIKVNLASGATTNVVISFKIGADIPTGTYTFKGVVTLDGDVSAENDSVATEDSKDILWAFGQIDGRKGNAKLTLTEEDGSVVTFTLSGNGLGTVTLAEDGGYDIAFTGTNSKTSITLTAKGGEDGLGALHSITADADIGSFSAASFTLSGDLTLAYLKTLTLGDLTADATHTFTFDSESTSPISSITLGHAAGLTLTTTLSIGTLSILDTGGEGSSAIDVTAASIDTLKTRVDKKHDSLGDFSGNMTLTGKGDSLTFAALKSVSIAGTLSDSTWTVTGAIKTISVTGGITGSVIRSTGNMTSVTANYLTGSSLLAGVSDSISSGTYPSSDSDFDNTSTIGTVTLKGTTELSSDFVISAFTVGTMKLGRITDGGTYGVFVASANPDTPKVKPFGSVSFSYALDETKFKSVSWSYKKTFEMPATTEFVSGFTLTGASDSV